MAVLFSSKLNGWQRIQEAGVIIFIALAIVCAIALFSFNPSDPSWSQSSWQGHVDNAAGSIGAMVSDGLFFLFGWIAYLVPLMLAGLGYLLFWRPAPIRELSFFNAGLRLIGCVLAVISATALASVNFNNFYYFSSGGLIGDLSSSVMDKVLGNLGSTIIWLALLAIGVTLLTGVSWVTIVESIGESLQRLVGLVKDKFGNRGDELVFENTSSQIDESDDQEFVIEHKKSIVSPLKRLLKQRNSEDEVVQEEGSLTDEADWLEEDLSDRQEPHFDIPVITNDFAQDEAPVRPEAAPQNKPTVTAAPKAQMVAPANAKTLADFEPAPKPKDMAPLPDMSLLDRPDKKTNPVTQEELDQVARLVEVKLLDFNVEAKVVAVHPGPVITRFELDLAPGVKVNKITNLSKDLARALSAISVRVVEVIPGKSVIGLELPNEHREIVYLSEVLNCSAFHKNKSPLTMVLGSNISGDPVVVDLSRMPHLLVAGTTGSGKSVGVNVMIISMLYKSTPEDVRMIMIDPKMLELSVYDGIPHLLCEVVTDMKEAANALRWCVGEMERRYKLMSAVGVRNLKGYNAKVKEANARGEPIADPLWKPGDSMDEQAPPLEKLPSIVVVVDEFADMMMIVGKKVEELIARIAQKARAAGIHLILATQRPSVDVITGLIKANIPTRIAFQVSSKVDSRTILDQQGAETLLGQGDMLYLPPGTSVPTRVHGAFVDDDEVHRVVSDWKLRGQPDYIDEILNGDMGPEALLPGEQPEGDEEIDELYDQAVAFVTETRRGSVSGVQRKFKIGYNRAARIVEQMQAQGVVSAPGHNGNREVIAPPPVRTE
ncbi:DNA translocase FtsK [Celerinatantimonas diazotrophica]|uniref:DNA translocase FtsK n=1 Tax=Celerinatantimonas diazotrophica TaxID=412034 RepID=A0A4R1J7L8_9GAMM|nr:DNA translocase FtsK [Celerinatantimonas diazotrophica]TCK46521.1 DNA translocase FtsK [Celerinatantimonas diazotrophica]CAG9296571.1 DNA translocase FtsK [Celerinatantimonas diazotrophica]